MAGTSNDIFGVPHEQLSGQAVPSKDWVRPARDSATLLLKAEQSRRRNTMVPTCNGLKWPWHVRRAFAFGRAYLCSGEIGVAYEAAKSKIGSMPMDAPNKEFALAGSLEELKAKGRLVVHGRHRPILVIYDHGRVFALDNRCPHMGFPLERGSVEDGILTCHWHHARFDLASGCTFDLWADDVPTCPVEVHNGEVWVKTTFGYADPAAHWRQRLADGLAHDLGLVIAKAVHSQLAADVPPADIVRQVALFGVRNRDGWGVGLTILTALANLLPALPNEEAYLALFHGARRVADDCEGEAPRRERAPLASRPDPAALKRWLRRWTNVRHREAAE